MKSKRFFLLLFLSTSFLFSFSNNSAKANFYLTSNLISTYGVNELPLFNIISEPENNFVHNLILDLDENYNIINIIRKSGSNQQVITIEELTSNKEIVVAKNGNIDILFISCQGVCTKENGGTIQFKYLYNGIYNSFGKLNLILKKVDATTWMATTTEGKKINQLRITRHYFLGQVIGINLLLDL
ncbi:MAG: hypothetical protein HQK49_00380 [Oligoflexia bacterium]|nr:hypothetical protein [Oligoflexia bacterium]